MFSLELCLMWILGLVRWAYFALSLGACFYVWAGGWQWQEVNARDGKGRGGEGRGKKHECCDSVGFIQEDVFYVPFVYIFGGKGDVVEIEWVVHYVRMYRTIQFP